MPSQPESTNPSSSNVDELMLQLRECISRKGLKSSRQRDVIASVFFGAGGHLSVDELLERVRQVDDKVSQATVYRTMNLLKECGLAEPRNFFEGRTLYELADRGDEHHDHLICTACGKIVEFVDPQIEKLQEKIVSKHGFRLTAHKMELYGDPVLNRAGECTSCHQRPAGRREPH